MPELFANVDGTLYGMNGTALDDRASRFRSWREIYNGLDFSDAFDTAQSFCPPGSM